MPARLYFEHLPSSHFLVQDGALIARGRVWVWDLRTYANYTGGLNANAVIAHDGRQLAGIFRYQKRQSALHADGTYEWRAFRGRGLGLGLWRLALDIENPNQVRVHVATLAGAALVKTVKRAYSTLDVKTTYDHTIAPLVSR